MRGFSLPRPSIARHLQHLSPSELSSSPQLSQILTDRFRVLLRALERYLQHPSSSESYSPPQFSHIPTDFPLLYHWASRRCGFTGGLGGKLQARPPATC